MRGLMAMVLALALCAGFDGALPSRGVLKLEEETDQLESNR